MYALLLNKEADNAESVTANKKERKKNPPLFENKKRSKNITP